MKYMAIIIFLIVSLALLLTFVQCKEWYYYPELQSPECLQYNKELDRQQRYYYNSYPNSYYNSYYNYNGTNLSQHTTRELENKITALDKKIKELENWYSESPYTYYYYNRSPVYKHEKETIKNRYEADKKLLQHTINKRKLKGC